MKSSDGQNSAELESSIRGRIFDIQRFSIHDGPGIRTTVFMKGCPLRCLWCQNPESISSDFELSFLPDKCIGCGYCFKACRHGAHRMVGDIHVLDRDLCKVCGTCTEECYSQALELVGKDVSTDHVIAQVLRDRPFYENSGGGMTLSGGEPTLQVEFAQELLQKAKEADLHCAVDTCGFCEFEKLERLRPFVDLFLYDLKETDENRHIEFTGFSNHRILDNLHRLDESGAQVRLRCPIIPGCNDWEDHFKRLAEIASELVNLEGVELIPYHTLGESKIERIGKRDVLQMTSGKPDRASINKWAKTLAEFGIEVIGKSGTQY